MVAYTCRKLQAASNTLVVAAIVVDARTSQGAEFYRQFGCVD
ncbi:hypothetical protein [Methylocaldum marinum]|nr:hypothetical protein [Methylocaldum marinum]